MEENQEYFGGIEQQISNSMAGGFKPKAYSDKLLAKEDVDEIKDLVAKDFLTSSDLRRLVYLLSGTEIKLVNFGNKDRYLIGKYLTWIRAAVKLQETNLRQMEALDDFKVETKEQHETRMMLGVFKGQFVTTTTKKIYKTITEMLDSEIKYLCNIYLYLTRSSLSLGATAFDQLGANRTEYEYRASQGTINEMKEAKGFFSGRN